MTSYPQKKKYWDNRYYLLAALFLDQFPGDVADASTGCNLSLKRIESAGDFIQFDLDQSYVAHRPVSVRVCDRACQPSR